MGVANSQLLAQVDPTAHKLWNRLADGDHAVLDELTMLLQEDFPTFCGLLLKVRPKGGGYTAPFIFNQVQLRMWREICKRIEARLPPWFVVLKFRQAGMSTFWCAWLFWQMWRQRDIQAMVVAHQLQTAETMIETQRVFYDELPEIWKPELREGNHGASIPRGEIYFKDRRCWELIHLSKNVDPRGQQVSYVLETEMAMYHDPEELNGALLPQLPPFGSEAQLRSSVIVESTPKGQNAFHDMYVDAREGKRSQFKAVFFPWFLFDDQYSAKPPHGFKLMAEEKEEQKRLSNFRMHDYSPEDGGGQPVTLGQMYWRRETIASTYSGDMDRFDQEYPSDDKSCFLLSSKSVFREQSRTLDRMVQEAQEHAANAWSKVMVDGKPVKWSKAMRIRLKPKIKEERHWTPITDVAFEIHPHGMWQVWEPPQSGHKYVVGADPAMGLEDGDASTICVIDVTAARQVAEFQDQMGPERFAIEIAAAGYWYNQALLVPEINNIGYVVLKRLLANITYPNMYRWPHFDEVNKFTKKRGWETNSRTKQLLVSGMINYIDEELISIASTKLLAEMSTFEQKNDGDILVFGAQKGRHDDLVLAFGLALMGIDQTPSLSTELNRSQSRVPSARELHLAGTMDVAPTPLPKQLETFLTVKQDLPWNPIQGGFL